MPRGRDGAGVVIPADVKFTGNWQEADSAGAGTFLSMSMSTAEPDRQGFMPTTLVVPFVVMV